MASLIEEQRTTVALLTGGGDRPYALGLANALCAAGCQIDFIGSDDLRSPELERNRSVTFLNLRGDQNPTAPFGAKVARICLYYFRLVMYASRSRSRVFHILWNNKFELIDRVLLMLFYKALGKKICLTAHNVNIKRRDEEDSWWNRLTLRIQYSLCDHLFVHTEKMKAELDASFGVQASKVTVIPFGVNSSVPQSSLSRRQARELLGLDSRHKVILFFGNIAPYKGLDHLVRAFAHASKLVPDMRLIIAGRPKGSEDYWRGISDYIATSDCKRQILCRIEYVPDADTEIYFKAADVVALPYTDIFQSGVLFLGFNFGLPAIASDVGSLREDICRLGAGVTFPARNDAALAECISSYFVSPLYRDLEKTKVRIRDLAAHHFSWNTVAQCTIRTYGQVTTPKRRAHFDSC